jgi:hypothetical protein
MREVSLGSVSSFVQTFDFCLAKLDVISYDSFMKTPTLSTDYVHRSLRLCGLFLIPLLFAFGLLPRAQAAGPDTDGTIPGSNNGEGIGVLVSRTTRVWNTGTGFEALNRFLGRRLACRIIADYQ